ncbi:MAG: nucleoside triphosphate pyrophosphohydrolase [Spirochaetes bacterium]|jgi:tetrapyrrole methylase family protein/MazG family protein|nr:nucleoside triphosphate pyrophosphohydrolase [Spirochaetota bacterium]
MKDIDIKKYLKETRPLYALMELASVLRGKKGCPWDRAQTSDTLKPYLIEEAYEAFDAIENRDNDNLREELGDLLYQIYAHSVIAEEEGLFTIDDVAESIIKKMIFRHPHVFGDEKLDSKEEVIDKWEILKKKEKKAKDSVLDGVPVHLPALLKAYRIQQKASKAGFDWDKISDVRLKLDEEIDEFKKALDENDQEKISEEIGDLLFTIVNISRFVKVNPEEALSKTIKKFIKRFSFIEKELKTAGKNFMDMTMNELDEIWDRAKKM